MKRLLLWIVTEKLLKKLLCVNSRTQTQPPRLKKKKKLKSQTWTLGRAFWRFPNARQKDS